MRATPSCSLLLASLTLPFAAAQHPRSATDLDRPAAIPVAESHRRLERVLVDEPGDGRIWALAESYKAAFDARGFEYVPFFGADAPANYPLRFALRAVTIAAEPLALPAEASVSRGDLRVTLARGPVDEIYLLGLDEVEQRFVVRCDRPGDLTVSIEVTTGLDPAQSNDGIAWRNDQGTVSYGAAFVVDGVRRQPITTERDGNLLRLHVPAAMRRGTELVIDPVIRSHPQFNVSQGSIYSDPDIAVLHPGGRYLIAYERAFSSRDSDIVSELHDAQGFIPGSLAAVEATTAVHVRPRVAAVKAAARFLVVSQQDSSSTSTSEVWGRALDGNTGAVATNLIRLSDASPIAQNHSPDVGGDPGQGLGPHPWCVAWIRQNSATDADVVARVFDQHLNTVALQATVVADLPNGRFANVAVSSSNANGTWATPRWALVYELQTTATNHDLHAATVDLNAQVVTPSGGIDSFAANTRFPCVSSPATDLAIPGGPHFLVTFQDLTTQEARARLLGATLRAAMSPPNLTRSFGLGLTELQNETDGCRFAITSRSGSVATVATFGATTSGMVLMEAPQTLAGSPAQVRLCGAVGGGGDLVDYGIAYQDQATPATIRWTLYEGRQPGSGFQRRIMGCGGLGIQEGGQPFLGARIEFALSNVNAFQGGFLVGGPLAAAPILCAACPLGVDPTGPLVGVVATASLAVPIPCDYGLLGARLAVQGFSSTGGPCPGGLRFSDTIDFTIR
ncbi:MAG: hypothetical protein IPM29_29615 [Planctomycetes bacterium]|nr:hypothetical protein [Planctomycetota bacterium]